MSVKKFPNKEENQEARVSLEHQSSLLLDFDSFLVAAKKCDDGHYKLEVLWHDNFDENIFHFWDVPGTKVCYSFSGNWRDDRRRMFWSLVKSIWMLVCKYDDRMMYKTWYGEPEKISV